MPKKRRKKLRAFSLFAFQDIITSVTGIVILITLLLAIELMDRVESSPASQTKKVVQLLDVSIEELQQEKAVLQKRLDAAAIDADDLPTTDEGELDRLLTVTSDDVQRLKSQIATANSDLAGRKTDFSKRKSDAYEKQAQEELDDLNKKNSVAQKELENLKNSDRMFFKSDVKNKTVWLVEVTKDGYLVAKLGEEKKPEKLQTLNAFRSWAAKVPASRTALYLVVKQSGVGEKFSKARDILLAKKIDFGFEVADESRKFIDPVKGAGL